MHRLSLAGLNSINCQVYLVKLRRLLLWSLLPPRKESNLMTRSPRGFPVHIKIVSLAFIHSHILHVVHNLCIEQCRIIVIVVAVLFAIVITRQG